MAFGREEHGRAPGLVRPPAALPRDARLVLRDVWPEGPDGAVIVHEQYQCPARWWQPATRFVGHLMILLAIGWPVVLLSSGWPRTGLAFAVADFTLLVTGWEVMTSGETKWLSPDH